MLGRPKCLSLYPLWHKVIAGSDQIVTTFSSPVSLDYQCLRAQSDAAVLILLARKWPVTQFKPRAFCHHLKWIVFNPVKDRKNQTRDLRQLEKKFIHMCFLSKIPALLIQWLVFSWKGIWTPMHCWVKTAVMLVPAEDPTPRSWERPLPCTCRGDVDLPTPWSWTSGLRN